MRKLISSILVFSIIVLTPMKALAECDFSKGVEKLADGRYAYSVECHKKVGKLVQDNQDREEQVAKLNKTIELKDLEIVTHERRAELWMSTATKLEDRVNSMEAMKSTNQWLFFGLGFLAAGASVWAASQLVKR